MMLLGCGSSGSSITYTPPLDAYAINLAAAFSVSRKLLSSYAGSAVRIRRSSDNAESDIAFASSGWLDVGAANTFIGGGTGYIVTCYDQSGNGRDITNPTAAQQPIWVTLSNGIAAARFSSAGHRLQAATFTLAQPYSRLHTTVSGIQASGRALFDGGAADASIGYTGTVTAGAAKQYIYAGAFLPAFDTSTVTTNNNTLFCGRYEVNAGSSLLKIGSNSATGNAGSSASGGITIGNRFNGTGGSAYFQDFHEHFVWSNIDQTRNETLRLAQEASFA